LDTAKLYYKTTDVFGSVEMFSAWSVDDKDWAERAESAALNAFKQREKNVTDDALAELVNRVGPNPRQLESEVEKLCLFAGERKEVKLSDVQVICSRNKTARAFALGDALGDRDLPRLLKRLDEELWETKFDKDKSEIGLLYGLISKVRAMLFLKEMLREDWVKETRDYNSFKAQLERVPADKLPTDRKFNPLAVNPYVLYKALPQARKYSSSELVQAMETLLRCNQRLVSSQLDEALVLQQTLVQIVTPTTAVA
jgi:DNA polymerase-3 subunit delta